MQHLIQPSQLLPAACNTPPSPLFHLFTFFVQFLSKFQSISSFPPFPAPPGCLQYFTNPVGTFESFNFGAPSTSPYLANTKFSITSTWPSLPFFLKANDHYHTIKSLNRSIINHKQYKCMKSYMIISCNNSNENHQIRNLLPTLPWNL